MGSLVIVIARLVNFAIAVYIWIIIVRALISWFNPNPNSRLVRLIEDLTEPVLRPVRRILPYMGGIDLSPLVVLIILYFVRSIIVSALFNLGMRLY